MDAVGIIPARLESSRLPEKAIKNICGLPMIVHVLKRCELSNCLDEVYVATDSKIIKDVVEKYDGKVIMTSRDHITGTDRIAEASKRINSEIIVNIQGDEALVNPMHIDKVTSMLTEDKSINVAILINQFFKKNSPSDIKVVLNQKNEVMYFSRSDIPNDLRGKNRKMFKAYHIVPFRKSFLIEYSNWEKGILESIEFNEYLRILEKGYQIKAVEVESHAISVDTEEDLFLVRNEMKRDPFFPLYFNKL